MKTTTRWALLPLALMASGLVHADKVRLYGAQEVPNAEEIADILRGPSAQAPAMKMRGISLDPSYQKSSAAATQEALTKVSRPAEDAFALPVQFGFNSAEILPDAEPQLDAVAAGIKLVPGARVVVEGHTDAHGPDAYNNRLSQLRASAVKHYLVERHGINPSKLVIEGLGEQAPINSTDPYASENRRVQFRPAQ
jgi:outer membrane protein OmpA-like peptidoglycan-associated protein